MARVLQAKDHFYDQFIKNPTKDNFRDFMKKSCGELNEMDFKEQWIEKGSLAKIMLAMANSGDGIVIFGVKENDDNSYEVIGLNCMYVDRWQSKQGQCLRICTEVKSWLL